MYLNLWFECNSIRLTAPFLRVNFKGGQDFRTASVYRALPDKGIGKIYNWLFSPLLKSIILNRHQLIFTHQFICVSRNDEITLTFGHSRFLFLFLIYYSAFAFRLTSKKVHRGFFLSSRKFWSQYEYQCHGEIKSFLSYHFTMNLILYT